jgi:hypothetical protein
MRGYCFLLTRNPPSNDAFTIVTIEETELSNRPPPVFNKKDKLSIVGPTADEKQEEKFNMLRLVWSF